MQDNGRLIPLLPLRGVVVFPGTVISLDVGREFSVNAVNAAMLVDKQLLVVAQREADTMEPKREDLYSVGTIVEIVQLIKVPSGALKILIKGLSRAKLLSVIEAPVAMPYLEGYVQEQLVKVPEQTVKFEALRNLVFESFEKLIRVNLEKNKEPGDEPFTPRTYKSASEMAEHFAGLLSSVTAAEKQALLEIDDLEVLLRKLYEISCRKLEIAEIEKTISQEVRSQIEQNQKEYYLREQVKAINKELGEDENRQRDVDEYKRRMAEMTLPEAVQEKLNKELNRLLRMSPMMPESGVIRDFIETLLSLPWGKYSDDSFDLKHVATVLNKDHYGLEKVKERILEYLAVRALNSQSHGPILCLVGPPGVGKTSLAQSIAHALDRKYTRLSLGGVHDEAEIRGHRRTYIGSMPGRIIHGMQGAGVMNPVFLLDEVDKMASDFRGDPASALLEVLDPEQNNTFSDHYIELPFDLSGVFWIVTANTVETIPPALLDRMEIVELSSYTEDEKVNIAKLHLVPKERVNNGLTAKTLQINEEALREIIRGYTREAGVRNLERKIAAICRKTALKIVSKEAAFARVTAKNLSKYLGKVIFLEDGKSIAGERGICTGLAWTQVGGELLKVEVLACPGKGNLTLTGQLGSVMRESAQAGYTYIRSRAAELALDEHFYENIDIHIHLPEGAIPKDGPSAGITMVTAMVSALTGRKVKGGIAMTGEITLSGKVLPVGGIKEKFLAASRYGIKTIIMPQKNLQDLDELPANVREVMTFLPVTHMDEVLKLALEEKNE